MRNKRQASTASVIYILLFISVEEMAYSRSRSPSVHDLMMYLGSLSGKAYYLGYRYGYLQNWLGANDYCLSHDMRLASFETESDMKVCEDLLSNSLIDEEATGKAFWLNLSSHLTNQSCPITLWNAKVGDGLKLGTADCQFKLTDMVFCEAED